MIRTLIRCLIALIVLGLVYYLGTLLLTAIHAPAVFVTIWMVLVILIAILALWRMFDGGPNNRLW